MRKKKFCDAVIWSFIVETKVCDHLFLTHHVGIPIYITLLFALTTG